MLRVTIELLPLGIEEKARVIGKMIIANDGTGDPKYGNYDAWFTLNEGSKPKFSRITKFHRLRSAWDLVWLLVKESRKKPEPTREDVEFLERRW